VEVLYRDRMPHEQSPPADLINEFYHALGMIFEMAKSKSFATKLNKIHDQLTAILLKFRCSLNYIVNSPSDINSSKGNTEEIPEAVDIKTSLEENFKELRSFIESLTGQVSSA
jgi:hypothetical protein